MSSRNLGATAATWEGHGEGKNTGSLHYTFGRKDPFAASLGNMDTTKTAQNFAWSVKNPVIFVGCNGSWTTQDQSLAYMWHDKNIAVDTDAKSIFDPSPIGWRLPIYGTWDDFSANCTAISDNVGTYTPASANYYALGYRNTASINVSGVGTQTYIWTSTTYSSGNSRDFRISTTAATSTGTSPRTRTNSIRPVRE